MDDQATLTGANGGRRLASYVERLLAKAQGNPAPIFALRWDEEWDGPDSVQVREQIVDICYCASELAVREVLTDEAPRERPLVLLTPLDRLADDVRARLSIRKLVRPRPDDLLADLFGVRTIDPRVKSWLVTALVEAAPVGGYEKTGARSLDLERAWRALLLHGYGIDLDQGLEELLTWAAGEHAVRLAEASDERRTAVVEHVSRAIEGAAPVMACAIAGRGPDAVPLGLVVRALADAPESADRIKARTRLELALDGWFFEEAAARAWARAAEAVLSSHRERDERVAQRTLQQADRLVEELQATSLVAASDVLPSGLRARQVALATALEKQRDVEAAVRDIVRHESALATGAAEAATMAQRLARWLALPESQPPDLVVAASEFASSGAYADLARTVLRHGGGEPALDEALRGLVQAADARRAREEERFARLLAEWSARAETHAGLLGVEDVLREFVAPLAKHGRVLVVVLDGMSHRVAAELLEDAARHGWTELRRATHPDRALVVSALPSVTRFSRASLFSGELREGLASDEEKAFEVHPDLVAASDRHGRPLLFHKGRLSHPEGGLSQEVEKAIGSERRIVGLVINAIDDHLARSDQVRSPWRIRDVVPLRNALDAARSAGRLVVLVSDHGHVLERGGKQRSKVNGGDRWRFPSPDLAAGEVLVEGPRVVVEGRRCVMAVDERLRYGAKKHGYHGGATAQEVLTPVVALAPTLMDEIEGWVEAPYDPPAWWTGTQAPETLQEPLQAAAAIRPPAENEQLTLERPSGDGWITELLASETLANQRALAARTPLPDDRIATILQVLDARGGRMLLPALSQATGIPPARLRGALAVLRLLLNVDGYDVLTIDEPADSVELNVPLLREQFELSP